jgi:hypothetical protein
MRVRLAAVPLVLSFVFSPALAAENKTRAEQRRQAPSPRGGAPLNKLLKMSPAEREVALSKLPPARRENIEKRIGEIQRLPPAQQNRVMNRLELLNALPPQRANQVRRSAKQFQELPQERKIVLNREMRRMAPLPDEGRRDRMNSEEFRNRYSAKEQQMMQDLMEVQPQP